MFGPTFANLKDLGQQHAIIISESDHLGKAFFKDFYTQLGINIHDYTFDEHDQTIAYSLSTPFVSTLVFAACMKKQQAPGTTFKKHLDITKGLLSEDDYLLTEILLNPYTIDQIDRISNELAQLSALVKQKDAEGLKAFLAKVRKNFHE
jgi:prephenate dehydrogenase